MLKISQAQYNRFRESALDEYVQRTAEQFQRYLPGPCYAVKDSPLRAMIRFGVERARRHGIEGECNVVLYTSMMLLFGSYFDEDPQYPWARAILARDGMAEAARAEQLYDTGAAFLDHVTGDYSGGFAMSVVRVRRSLKTGSHQHTIRDQLYELNSKKAEEIGDSGLEHVIARGRDVVDRYSLYGLRDQEIVTYLVFGLGIGFDEDPLYPWAGEILGDSDCRPADKSARLLDASVALCDRWLTYIRQDTE